MKSNFETGSWYPRFSGIPRLYWIPLALSSAIPAPPPAPRPSRPSTPSRRRGPSRPPRLEPHMVAVRGGGVAGHRDPGPADPQRRPFGVEPSISAELSLSLRQPAVEPLWVVLALLERRDAFSSPRDHVQGEVAGRPLLPAPPAQTLPCLAVGRLHLHLPGPDPGRAQGFTPLYNDFGDYRL